MSDYIKKDDIIKWVDDSVAQCGNRYSADMLNMMDMFKTVVDNCLPFANVVPAELYQRALNDVVTLSAERKHRKWIPVTERLPEYMENVLITDGVFSGMGWRDWYDYRGTKPREDYWIAPSTNVNELNITHWMPLPEPPKDGEA